MVPIVNEIVYSERSRAQLGGAGNVELVVGTVLEARPGGVRVLRAGFAAVLAVLLGLFAFSHGRDAVPRSVSPPAARAPTARQVSESAALVAVQRLPAGAQAAISRTLASGDAAVRAVRMASGWRLRGGGLDARFDPGAVRLSAASSGWVSLSPLVPGRPRLSAAGDRVTYRYAHLEAWYQAGPLGIEQGFTVRRRPARESAGVLTLALRVAGPLRLRSARGRQGFVFVDSRGRIGLRYGGLSVTDARGRALACTLVTGAGRLLIRVHDASARYPLRIDPFIELASLTLAEVTGSLGPVAVSGSELVVGAPSADIGTRASQGAVFVFRRPPVGWSGNVRAIARLVVRSGRPGDRLGSTVAVAGGIVVAGAPGATVGSHVSAGAVYVFRRPAAGWAGTVHEAAALEPRRPGTGLVLGSAVAVSGGTVVVGAPLTMHGMNGRTINAGSVYVFVQPARGWSGTVHEAARLTASDGVMGDLLGTSVAVAGGTIVAGRGGGGQCESNRAGAVYVFTRPHRGWRSMTQSAELTTDTFDDLGASVAISGRTIAAGAPLSCDKYQAVPGSVFVFSEPTGGWRGRVHSAATLSASDWHGNGDNEFGASVALSGSTVIATAFTPPPASSSPPTPAVYVFDKPAGGWASETRAATVASPAGTSLPDSVAISGDSMFAGASVYTRSAAGWSGSARLSAPHTAQVNGGFATVAAAGDTVAVGALGGGGPARGAVYVFTRPAGGWTSETHAAVLTASDGAAIGSSVAISGRAIVASAAPAGEVYVFTRPPTGWASGTEAARLVPSDGDPGGQFGDSVAVAGSTVVVGAPSFPYPAPASRGAVYVYTQPAGGWSDTVHEVARLTTGHQATPGDLLGLGVAISGSTIVASALGADVGAHRQAGAVYVFQEPSRGWSSETPTAKLYVSDATADYPLGPAVAVSGETVAVGRQVIPDANHNAGAVYVYVRPRTGWPATMRATAKLTAPATSGLGQSIAVSGRRVFAGALGNVYTYTEHGSVLAAAQSNVYTFAEPAHGWGSGQARATNVAIASPGVGVGVGVAYSSGNVFALGGLTAPGDEIAILRAP